MRATTTPTNAKGRKRDEIDDNDAISPLLQRIALLEKLTAKLMMDNDKLIDKVAYLENGDMANESSLALSTMKSSVENTLNEVLSHFHTTSKLVEQSTKENSVKDTLDQSTQQLTNEKKNQTIDNAEMISLMSGDYICLRHDGKNRSIYIYYKEYIWMRHMFAFL